MNVSLKTFVPAVAALTVAAGAIGCSKDKQQQQPAVVNYNSIELAPYDSTKANLPIIRKENKGYKVTFRTTENEIKTVDAPTETELAVYKAVSKLSTEQNPNITKTNKFYTLVQFCIGRKYRNWNPDWAISEDLRALQLTDLFEKLYTKVTDPSSDGGKDITVEEYTDMMVVWSSTERGVDE